MEYPSISVIIPTYNSARTLNLCLNSIIKQNYPKDFIEIIIADAGSADQTLKIARRYTDKIYKNPLKTGEAGKAVGIKKAQSEIIAFIDSDNILPQRDWFKRMVIPFHDPQIVGSEPIRYTYRKKDRMITRYSALMGLNDPLCYFLGNYDRVNSITEKWTAFPIKTEDKGNYLKFQVRPAHIPTIGANGFLIKKECLLKTPNKDYLFDIDVVYSLSKIGYAHYAKVKIGIIHIFAGNTLNFIRKQKRRIKDYLYYQNAGLRAYQWKDFPRKKIVRFIAYSLTIFPTFLQSLKGYAKRPDSAWFFHPLACFLTCIIYSAMKLKSYFVKNKIESREKWQR